MYITCTSIHVQIVSVIGRVVSLIHVVISDIHVHVVSFPWYSIIGYKCHKTLLIIPFQLMSIIILFV